MAKNLERVAPSLNAERILEPKYLHERFTYNAITGEFFWKARPLPDMNAPVRGPGGQQTRGTMAMWNKRFAGKPAFTNVTASGYRSCLLGSVPLYAHLVAWIMHYGRMPEGYVKYRDRNRDNLRISNLYTEPFKERRPAIPEGTKIRAEPRRGRDADLPKRYVAIAVVKGERKSLGAYPTWKEALRRCEAYVRGEKNA